jgi:DNA-directed RNA polymerase specialized sigma24 family protein
VNGTNTDFTTGANQTIDQQSSRLSLTEVFFAELARLKRIIAGMGLSTSDGEDILQDVAVRALRQSGLFESREDRVRRLTKVTVNQCLMEHRRRGSFQRQAHEILKRRLDGKTASKAADAKAIVVEELELVRESLRQLDASLLAPMVLQYFCDLDSTEVGRILGLNPSTVRGRLREGRMILAKRSLERGVGR